MYKLIRTRSPFYVKVSTTEDSAFCELRIWNGTISAKPTDATYQLSKAVSAGAATFEISELVRDYILQKPSTNGTIWVETVSGDGVAAATTETYLATEGYHLFEEGLIHDSNAAEALGYALPIETSTAGAVSYRQYLPEGETGAVPSFVYVTPSSTDDNQSVLSQSSIGTNDSIKIKTENSITYTVHVDRFRCSKFQAKKLTYVNKLGARAQFWFTLKSLEKLSYNQSVFNRSLTNVNNLYNGNTEHIHSKRVNDVKKSYTLNTDFISEYYNAQIEELLLSEYVWIDLNGTDIPVNIATNSLELKTNVNDKLIQYTFDVEVAANYVSKYR